MKDMEASSGPRDHQGKVSLKSKRTALHAVRGKSNSLSIRSACRILGLNQSTYFYKSNKVRDDEPLKAKIIELASKRSKDGRPRLLGDFENASDLKTIISASRVFTANLDCMSANARDAASAWREDLCSLHQPDRMRSGLWIL